jgi:hypothetical protein
VYLRRRHFCERRWLKVVIVARRAVGQEAMEVKEERIEEEQKRRRDSESERG